MRYLTSLALLVRVPIKSLVDRMDNVNNTPLNLVLSKFLDYTKF